MLEGMDNFLLDSILIPPGDWDRSVLSHTIPILADQSKQIASHRHQVTSRLNALPLETPTALEEPEVVETFDALERTGKFCGGLIRDVKRRFSMYKSDITDAFNVRCLVATIFVYFACLAPAISFGGLLNQKTDGWMGVSEMIFATALSGVVFALFAGQPLIIIGATGPLLVFEQNTYELCEKYDVEYMPWRAWVGLWVMVICFAIVAAEGCFLIQYFTRFTEEIFALLISIIFIYDGLSHIWKMYDYKKQMRPGEDHSSDYYLNIALFSTIVLFGTFLIAHSLRGIRHSHFFGHVTRRIVSDFGVLIAIICMIFLDMIASSIPTEKLQAGGGFTLTSSEREGWFVNPMGHKESMSIGNIIAALIPAILVSILLFMEVEFCNVILDKKDNKLKKGPGYNLDFFIVGLLVGLCSLLGLPWMCATPVHTVSHFHALSVLSTNNAPGEHPHLIEVKEQRVSNVVIHLLIGVTVVLSPVLRLIPISVLFGVFVFLGVSSLSHLQLCERAKLLIIPPSHHPDLSYVRNVSTMKMHMFTIVQLVCTVLLVAIKLTPVAPAFPFFIICLLPIRKFLERYYEEEELEELDHEVDEVYDSDLDDFDSIHVPV